MKQLVLVILVVSMAMLSACAPASAPAPVSTPTETPSSEISVTPTSTTINWDEAKHYIGERATVCGAIVDTHWASSSNGKPTFLNVGRSYPDPDRFTIVIWIQYRANFPQVPETYYLGKSICVSGLITEYNGGAQIEVKSPSQIQEQ